MHFAYGEKTLYFLSAFSKKEGRLCLSIFHAWEFNVFHEKLGWIGCHTWPCSRFKSTYSYSMFSWIVNIPFSLMCFFPQRFRMDDQRCSAPNVMKILASPAPPRKAHSRPASPTLGPPQPPKRSSSFNVSLEKENSSPSTQVSRHTERLYSWIYHLERPHVVFRL